METFENFLLFMSILLIKQWLILNRILTNFLKKFCTRLIIGSGWVIESIDAEYVNISIFSPLSGSTFIELPRGLKTQWRVWLIWKNKTKNNNNKCSLSCHIRHLNPLKIHLERITEAGIKMVNDVDYEGI